jgi:rRNA-processing protein EBP2
MDEDDDFEAALDIEQPKRIKKRMAESDNESDLELAAYMDTYPKLKVYKNVKEALLSRLADVKLELQFIDTCSVSSELVHVNVENELEREKAIYKQALDSSLVARAHFKALGKPFSRPDDYFAEMVKSDALMEKIRKGLIDEKQNLELSENYKKQRLLKKFGKKVQQEKVLERHEQKRQALDNIKNAKGDDFDVQIEKVNHKRKAKDSKYGFGGKKRGLKSNTAESTINYQKPRSVKGGKGSAKGAKSGPKRPGKVARNKRRK